MVFSSSNARLSKALVALLSLVFVASTSQALLVQTPCCSAYLHAGASFGPQLPWVSPGVTGTLSRSQDKECNGAVPNTIVLVDRGLESFVEAVKACQAKGATAVVVRNVASSPGSESDLIVMGAAHKDHGVTIPSVFVSRKTGDELDAMLAMNPSVFVELFAADDVNSIMAYMAYLIMSVETLFFGIMFFAVIAAISSRRSARRGNCKRCRRCRSSQGEDRTALIVNDNSLLEPLNNGNNNGVLSQTESDDPESKPPKESNGPVQAYPVVYGNVIATSGPVANGGNARREELVNLRVDPKNEEPVFDQQDQ